MTNDIFFYKIKHIKNNEVALFEIHNRELALDECFKMNIVKPGHYVEANFRPEVLSV